MTYRCLYVVVSNSKGTRLSRKLIKNKKDNTSSLQLQLTDTSHFGNCDTTHPVLLAPFSFLLLAAAILVVPFIPTVTITANSITTTTATATVNTAATSTAATASAIAALLQFVEPSEMTLELADVRMSQSQ